MHLGMLGAYKEKTRGSTSDAAQTGLWKNLISTFRRYPAMFAAAIFMLKTMLKK